jgi:hypothetical protein
VTSPGATLPLMWRCFLKAGGWMATRTERAGWRARWGSRMSSLLVLWERGELPGEKLALMAWLCRAAWVDAFWTRVHKPSLREWSLGPWFVLTWLGVGWAALGAWSNGFAVSRWLVEMTIGPHAGRMHPLFPYALPIVAAAIAGGVLMFQRPLALRGFGWRYWIFFLLKTAMAAAGPALLWVEGGAKLRAHLDPEWFRLIVGGLVCAAALVIVFCRSIVWCVADQRVRCPVCLRRLAMPVSLGSSSSVLDPAKTELLCSAGHGSLSMDDSDSGEGDRWTALDETWQSLFEETTCVQ